MWKGTDTQSYLTAESLGSRAFNMSSAFYRKSSARRFCDESVCIRCQRDALHHGTMSMLRKDGVFNIISYVGNVDIRYLRLSCKIIHSSFKNYAIELYIQIEHRMNFCEGHKFISYSNRISDQFKVHLFFEFRGLKSSIFSPTALAIIETPRWYHCCNTATYHFLRWEIKWTSTKQHQMMVSLDRQLTCSNPPILSVDLKKKKESTAKK